jgi:hypothetical protein
MLVVALAGVMIVGCSSNDDDNGSRVDRPRACNLYLRDQGVSVRMAGKGAERTCNSWLASRAEVAGTWSRSAGAEAGSGFERVCVVFRGDTAAGLYSSARPGSVGRAEGVCASLREQGWKELNPPRTASSSPDSNGQPEASWFAPVRCAEGHCRQEGKQVAQPPEGATCGEGLWTYVGISADGQAGVYECLIEPEPGSAVTCDSYNERCRQAGHLVRPPEAGEDCGSGDRTWEEAAGNAATSVYRCGRG